jgi:nucleoside-diphosphate-sugar epimerase
MRFIFFGNGYITRSLVKYNKEKSKIVIFSRTKSIVPYPLICFDIKKDKQVNFDFLEDDVLIYSIALKTPGSSYSGKDINEELEALKNFLDMVITKKIGKIVLISSAAVYGFGKLPFNEFSPYNPKNSYGVLKVEMEKVFLDKMNKSKISFNILRISNVYGSVRSKQGVINLLLFSIKDNNVVVIKNGGQDIRDFVYDRDLSNMFFKLLDSRPTSIIYNLSSFRGTKILDVVQTIVSLNPLIEYKIQYLDKDQTVAVSFLDNTLIKGEVQDLKTESFETSLKEIIDEIS